MAQQLVSAMTGEFDPAQYKDEYREALDAIIQAKVEGKETVEIEAPEETGKLIDLMAALEASVNAAKAAREAGTEAPVSVADAKAAKAGEGQRLEGDEREGQGRRRRGGGRRGRGRGGRRRQARPEAQDRLIRAWGAALRRARPAPRGPAPRAPCAQP